MCKLLTKKIKFIALCLHFNKFILCQEMKMGLGSEIGNGKRKSMKS